MEPRPLTVLLVTFVTVLGTLTAGMVAVQAYRPSGPPASPYVPVVRQFHLYLHPFELGEQGVRHWLPSTLVVREGDEVVLRLTNADSTASHGFALGAFNVWVESISPGQTVTVRFRAARPGVYPFGCSVAGCAPDHPGQVGQLVVLGGSQP